MPTPSPDGPSSIPDEAAPDLLPAGALLDHLEKTLADNYRKEIDQEENVWRSLPFFAAGLALQIAATVGIVGNLPAVAGWRLWLVAGAFGIIAAATIATLAFLGGSIAPARFRYVAPEPDLRAYAIALVRATAEPGDAATAFKNELARQYGLATHNNRLITQRRARRRALAGLCMLASVLATLALVGLTVWGHIENATPTRAGGQHVRDDQRRGTDTGRDGRGPGPGAAAGHGSPGIGQPTGDARGPEGLVGQPGATGDGQRAGGSGP